MASINGGMEIEEVAKKDPQSIIIEPFDPIQGPSEAQLDSIVKKLELVSEAK